MEVFYSKKFIKTIKKSSLKIKKMFYKRLDIFMFNKFEPILGNHELNGKYAGYRSLNISGDIRAVYKEDGII